MHKKQKKRVSPIVNTRVAGLPGRKQREEEVTKAIFREHREKTLSMIDEKSLRTRHHKTAEQQG
jgi:hypothetical protein